MTAETGTEYPSGAWSKMGLLYLKERERERKRGGEIERERETVRQVGEGFRTEEGGTRAR